jgi:hypothetical protein
MLLQYHPPPLAPTLLSQLAMQQVENRVDEWERLC